ncbi:MAG TPA: TonB-dependent receptor, partial [Chitinophagales bacterium]|nr:TonB-dependent receptor [Chitinophagales bacterium]
GGTPQQAYSLGLNYRSPKYWFITSTVNFVDRSFTEISPSRRTAQAVDLVDYKSDLWNSIVSQERINPKGVWTLDIFGGYSWRLKNQFKGLKKEQYLVLNVGINNITNNKKAQITAFEQLRFDVDGKDLNLFKNRYAYAYGINYFISLAWRMY